jgi:hypothetical protein
MSSMRPLCASIFQSSLTTPAPGIRPDISHSSPKGSAAPAGPKANRFQTDYIAQPGAPGFKPASKGSSHPRVEKRSHQLCLLSSDRVPGTVLPRDHSAVMSQSIQRLGDMSIGGKVAEPPGPTPTQRSALDGTPLYPIHPSRNDQIAKPENVGNTSLSQASGGPSQNWVVDLSPMPPSCRSDLYKPRGSGPPAQPDRYRPQNIPHAAPGATASSIPTAVLSSACQRRGYNPEWKIQQDEMGRFAVTVIANGASFKSPGFFPSERDAKLAAAKLALASFNRNGRARASRARPQHDVTSTLGIKQEEDADMTGIPMAPQAVVKRNESVPNSDPKLPEIRGLMKRVKTLLGDEVKEHHKDQPEVMAAFLEGMLAGSRLAPQLVAPMSHGQPPSTGRRGGGRWGNGYRRSRSRSPAGRAPAGRLTYRERSPVSQHPAEYRSTSARGGNTNRRRSFHRDGRGSALPDRWDHDMFDRYNVPKREM